MQWAANEYGRPAWPTMIMMHSLICTASYLCVILICALSYLCVVYIQEVSEQLVNMAGHHDPQWPWCLFLSVSPLTGVILICVPSHLCYSDLCPLSHVCCFDLCHHLPVCYSDLCPPHLCVHLCPGGQWAACEYGRPVGPTWSRCLSWSVPPLTCMLSMSRRSLSSSWAWRTTTAGNPAWAATVMMHILMRESHSKHVLRFVRKNVFTICNRKKFQNNWSNKSMSTFAVTQMLLWHSTWWRNNPHWCSHERDLN